MIYSIISRSSLRFRLFSLFMVISITMLSSIGAAGPITRYRPALTAIEAPSLVSPAGEEIIANLGPTLSWENPAGTTQVHLEVIPANNDGPGVNAYFGSARTSLLIPAPPGWYGLLPDMTYTWRVRVSDNPGAIGLDDPSWSTAAERRFRTPKVASDTLVLVGPSNGSTTNTRLPVLQWGNSRGDIFYYEVQMSKDFTFNTDPATASAMVYWELRHGGVTNPNNSYQPPASAPLEDNTTYYWRVRPRVQGDGTPLAWSWASSFHVRTSAPPSPTATPGPGTTPTPTPTPTIPGGGPPATSGDRIAFMSLRNGPANLWVVRPDGSGLFQLSPSTPLTTNDTPTWSKDGTKMAFVSDREGNREIYVMNADGTGALRLTNHPALDDVPKISPDGKKVAFISRRDGTAQQIYAVNTDGTGLIRITSNTVANWQPAWSPDSLKLLYGTNTGIDIISSNPDGSGQVNISNNPALDLDSNWSPDSMKVVFDSTRDGGLYEIYVMNADGTNPVNLSNNAANDVTPIWSPDGKKIAFVSNRSGVNNIYVMNTDGTGQVNVSNGSADDLNPSWSPDSTKIAFDSKRDGNREIYVVKVDGTGLTRITINPDDDYGPMWAPK
ncbi:MAG: Dipeptidyl-peptidase 5 [Nitrospira sp.]|nr:Dipeptidyl-peptidase 5 [Nitrospira sp.]